MTKATLADCYCSFLSLRKHRNEEFVLAAAISFLGYFLLKRL